MADVAIAHDAVAWLVGKGSVLRFLNDHFLVLDLTHAIKYHISLLSQQTHHRWEVRKIVGPLSS